MNEIIRYVLGDVFHFFGVVIIMALFFDGLASVIVAMRGGQPISMLSRVFGGSARGAVAPGNSDKSSQPRS